MRFTLLLIIFVCQISAIYSQDIIHIKDDDSLFQIGDKCSIRSSNDNNPYAQDVLGNIGFQKNETEHILLGGSRPDKVWIKLTIHNHTKENVFVESLYPQLDTASLYAVENGFLNQIQQTGQHLAFSSRSLDIVNPTFVIKPSDKPVVYLLSIKVKWACNVKLRLGTYKSLIREYHRNDLLTGIVYRYYLYFYTV